MHKTGMSVTIYMHMGVPVQCWVCLSVSRHSSLVHVWASLGKPSQASHLPPAIMFLGLAKCTCNLMIIQLICFGLQVIDHFFVFLCGGTAYSPPFCDALGTFSLAVSVSQVHHRRRGISCSPHKGKQKWSVTCSPKQIKS